MKKIILSLLFVLGISSAGFSQKYSYGLRGGLNHSMGGTITGESSGVGNWAGTAEAQGKIGYHIGAFGEVKFGKIFVRPEISYTSVGTEYEFPRKVSTHAVKKIDIPILLGYNIFGPIDIFAGPVYSNVLSSKLEGVEPDSNGNIQEVVTQNSPINFQFGTKARIGRFEVDLRYERILSSAELQRLDMYKDSGPVEEQTGANYIDFNDPRIHQIIVGVSYKIGGSDLKNRRRRGGNCY